MTRRREVWQPGGEALDLPASPRAPQRAAVLTALSPAPMGGDHLDAVAICDRNGLPIAVHVASASPYEPHLVPATVDARFLADLPTRLIGNRGYDSDALDELLMTQCPSSGIFSL